MTRPSGARCSSVGSVRPPRRGRSTSKTASSRFEAVSSGPKSRKLSGLRAMSRRKPPSTRVASATSSPGSLTVDRVVAEVGQSELPSSRPPFACGFALIRRSPFGGSAAAPATSAPSLVEQLLGPVAPHPRLEQREMLRVRRAPPRAAPGASATCPRSAGRRPPSGRSSPSACAARSSASAAGRARRRARLGAGCARSPRAPSSSAAAMRWCIARRFVALDDQCTV